MSTKSSNVMRVVISEARSIKGLINNLYELLPTGVIFHFTKDGIKIHAMDSSKTILIHVKLKASQFTEYELKEDISLGLSTRILENRIGTITNDDVVTFFYNDNDNRELRFGYEVHDENKKKYRRGFIKLLDINEDTFPIGKRQFASVVMVPSDEFQRICRDMKKINDVIEIKSVGKQLKFHCHNDDMEETVTLGEMDSGGVKFHEGGDTQTIVQAYYDLKNLIACSKGAGMSSNIILYMANDFPLVIDTEIGSLGNMKILLTPKLANDTE